MALFKILQGNESALPKNSNEGYMYITKDKGNIYVDLATSSSPTLGTHRIQLNAGCANALRDTNGTTYISAANNKLTTVKNLYFEGSGTTHSAQPTITWKTIASKTPYIGYAQDQSDATFLLMSIDGGSSYKNGLAIGGTSGNLLWKGDVVATTTSVTEAINTAINGAIAASY